MSAEDFNTQLQLGTSFGIINLGGTAVHQVPSNPNSARTNAARYQSASGELLALFSMIEKKARVHSMSDVLMELDRLLDVAESDDWVELAGERLIKILALVQNHSQERTA